MKRTLLMIMLLLPSLAYAAAAIRFTGDTYDFGKVKEGESLEHVFEFTSSGTEELRIERMSTS